VRRISTLVRVRAGRLCGSLTFWPAARGIKATVVGLDLDPENVATCRRRGGKCFLADVRVLAVDGTPPCVRGITLFHILEHIGVKQRAHGVVSGGDGAWWRTYPSIDEPFPPGQYAKARLLDIVPGTYNLADATAAQAVLRAAVQLPSSWLLIKGPNFDHDEAMRQLGFLRSFAAWHLHTCHFNSSHLIDTHAGASTTGLAIYCRAMAYCQFESSAATAHHHHQPGAHT